MTFTLTNAGPSPFGRKVAIALIEKGLAYEVKYDLPWGDGTCTPQHSPLEQLPILIEENGNCIYDSTYILEWLERRYPDKPLIPANVDDALETKLRQLLGERLLEVMSSLLLEIARPSPGKAWIDRQERKVLGVFRELDRLLKTRQLQDDQRLDLGDIAIGTTLLSMEYGVTLGHFPDLDLLRWRGRYPGISRYMEILEKRPSFEQTPYKPMDINIKHVVG